MGKLNQIDKAAASKGKGVETFWQFIKFIVVSLGAFVIQTCLPYLIKLPMSEEFLQRPYEFWIYSSAAAEKAGMATTGLGLFIALTASNILAQVFSFFVNKEKTFNSAANTKVVFPIYIIFTVALIAFSAWLQPKLVDVLMPKIGQASLAVSGAICGAIQFFLYFPVDKILFHKKKEEFANAVEAASEKTEEIKEDVADAAEEIKEEAAEAIDDVKEDAAEVKEEVSEAAEEAKEEAAEVIEDVKEEATEAVEEIKEAADEITE